MIITLGGFEMDEGEIPIHQQQLVEDPTMQRPQCLKGVENCSKAVGNKCCDSRRDKDTSCVAAKEVGIQ